MSCANLAAVLEAIGTTVLYDDPVGANPVALRRSMAGFDAVAMFVEEMSDEDDGFRYYQIFRPSDAMSSSGTRGAGFLVRVSYASNPSGSEGAITSDNAAIGVSSNADGTTIQLNAGAQYHVRRAIGIKVW